jgi:hypothetical protein
MGTTRQVKEKVNETPVIVGKEKKVKTKSNVGKTCDD